jgi:tetratricopeptide (TPR) repeat protein
LALQAGGEGPIAFFSLIAFFLLVWCAPSHAGMHGWIELRTPHFTVVSDATETDARRVALEFEQARGLLQHANFNARFDSRDPVVVLAVSGEDALRELLPQFWERRGPRPAAAYWRGPYRHCVAVRTDTSDHELFRRVLHEYVHLLTHATVPDLPVWLDEGVSEFWSSAIVHGDALEVGQPVPQDLRRLKRRPWIPLDELLAMERLPEGDTERLPLFYAQSWAVVHYLMLGGPSVHLELAPAIDSAALPQLESALAAYVSAGRFRTIRIEARATSKSDDRITRNDDPVRVLPPATALAIRAGCIAEGERANAALPLLTRALAENPDDASVLETLGYVHFQRNEPDLAASAFDRAIASGSGSHLAYFYRAILAGSVPNRLPEGPAISAADYLRQAIALNPDFAASYSRLAALYAQNRPDEALPLAQRATELEPDDPAFWVDLGRLLVSLRRPAEARTAATKGLAVARSVGSRKLVDAFVRELPN